MFAQLLLSAKHCVRLLVKCKEDEKKNVVIHREQLPISFHEISSLGYSSHLMCEHYYVY